MTTSSHFGCRIPLDLVGPILEYVWESGSREESQSDFATIALTCSAFSQEVERILYRSMTSRDLARQSAFIYRTAVDTRRAGYVRTYHTLDLRIWMENMSRSLNTELTTYLRFLPTALQNMANLKELYYDTYSPNEQSWVNNARWRGVPDEISSPITLLTDNMPTFPFMLRHFACISHSSNFSSAVPFLESQSSLHSLTIRTAPTSAPSMQKLMNPDILPNLIRLRCANAFAATIIRNRAIRMLALWLNAPAGRGQPISIFGDTDSSCATGSMEELRYLSFESPYRDAVRIGSYIVAATERADERASKLGSVSWMKDYLQSMQRLECLQILLPMSKIWSI
ncbi:hypothetical protein CPC08DRAFT_187038 [Agrocybe pediades]|nr:hypothetical protein CPC08DRAFT_187038 [Agrocybe pediades]